MAELAPQSKDGGYVRPSYGFKGQISTTAAAGAEFPWEAGRYHMCVFVCAYHACMYVHTCVHSWSIDRNHPTPPT